MRNIKSEEEIIIGADLNGHVGRDRSGFEKEHGGHSFGDRIEEGEDVLRFAQAYNLGLVNTFSQKQEEHLITYKSGNRRTTIDYILVKRTDLKAAKDCKVIPGESIAMQHRNLVMDYRLKTPRKKQTRKLNKQIRWWKLKKEEARAEYQASVTTKLDEIGLDLVWNKIQEILVSTAKEKLGQTSGKGAYDEKESLWWIEDTRRATKANEEAFKAYQKGKSEEQHCAYKEANKAAKRAVAMAKEEAYEELYTKLDTREGAKIIYKLAKSRDRRSTDISDIAYVKHEHGAILTESGKIKQRWKFFFDKLFNAENPREQLDELPTTEGPVECFSLDGVKKQMAKMGKGKACGPDELPIEAVHIILEYKAECIVEAFNNILRTNKMPNDWRKSRIKGLVKVWMVPIFKGKGDVLECNNYIGIKLMSHTMKLWERMIEARLSEITKIADNQFGFRPGKSTTEPIFALRMLQEKYRKKNKELHMVFVDLEKAYDRVPIWWSLRKKRVPEAYIKIIQDMYEDCETQVTTREGNTEYFNVKVGLHQGSAISPLLFIIIMDVLASEIDKEPPWAMLFADDLVLCETSKAEVERELEIWRDQFEKHGLRVSRTKTAYMPCNDYDNNPRNYEEIQLGDDKLNTVTPFKYLGSIFDSNGGAERDINNRVKLAWMKWKQMTGVLCDKKVPIKLKDKVYKTVIKPTMTYGAECWAVRKKDENRLHVAEMRMLRWIRGKTRKDRVRNQRIQEDANVCQMSTFLRQKRLHWYRHVKRSETDNLSRKMMDMVVTGKRRRGDLD